MGRRRIKLALWACAFLAALTICVFADGVIDGKGFHPGNIIDALQSMNLFLFVGVLGWWVARGVGKPGHSFEGAPEDRTDVHG